MYVYQRTVRVTSHRRASIVFRRVKDLTVSNYSRRTRRHLCLHLQAVPIFYQGHMRHRVFRARNYDNFRSFASESGTLLISVTPIFSLHFNPASIAIRGGHRVLQRSVFVCLFGRQRDIFVCGCYVLSVFFTLLRILRHKPGSRMAMGGGGRCRSLFFGGLPFV